MRDLVIAWFLFNGLLSKPVIAENDGNCALLAEKWLGRGRGASSFAVIVLGTSVGGGLMVDNQLIRGKHF